MPQRAALRDVPAQGEITAMQPQCPAGRAQGMLTLAVMFMEWSGWLIVKLNVMGDSLYPQLSLLLDK